MKLTSSHTIRTMSGKTGGTSAQAPKTGALFAGELKSLLRSDPPTPTGSELRLTLLPPTQQSAVSFAACYSKADVQPQDKLKLQETVTGSSTERTKSREQSITEQPNRSEQISVVHAQVGSVPSLKDRAETKLSSALTVEPRRMTTDATLPAAPSTTQLPNMISRSSSESSRAILQAVAAPLTPSRPGIAQEQKTMARNETQPQLTSSQGAVRTTANSRESSRINTSTRSGAAIVNYSPIRTTAMSKTGEPSKMSSPVPAESVRQPEVTLNDVLRDPPAAKSPVGVTIRDSATLQRSSDDTRAVPSPLISTGDHSVVRSGKKEQVQRRDSSAEALGERSIFSNLQIASNLSNVAESGRKSVHDHPSADVIPNIVQDTTSQATRQRSTMPKMSDAQTNLTTISRTQQDATSQEQKPDAATPVKASQITAAVQETPSQKSRNQDAIRVERGKTSEESKSIPLARMVVPEFVAPILSGRRTEQSASESFDQSRVRQAREKDERTEARDPVPNTHAATQVTGDSAAKPTERAETPAKAHDLEATQATTQSQRDLQTQSVQSSSLAPKQHPSHATEALKAALQQALEQSRRRLVDPDELRLSIPLAEFGTVDIDVRRDSEHYAVRIAADPALASIMEEQRHQLVVWLRDQGFQVNQLQVDVRAQSQDARSEAAFEQTSKNQKERRESEHYSARGSAADETLNDLDFPKPVFTGARVWTA